MEFSAVLHISPCLVTFVYFDRKERPLLGSGGTLESGDRKISV